MVIKIDKENINNFIVIGVITGKHGLKGLVKVKWFTETLEGLESYNPIKLSNNDTYFLSIVSENKGQAVCKLDNVLNANEAELLKGQKIFAERSRFPKLKENEYYQSDLVGCKVNTVNGKYIGEVTGVYDYGAGSLLEIGDDLIIFNDKNFPYVRTDNKEIFMEIENIIGNNNEK